MEPERTSYHHGNLRHALIEAGLELTRTGGRNALVMRDVARRVGVSPNAAYRHFADRDGLLAAVAERIQLDVAERMRSPEPAASSGAKAGLTAVGLGYIAFALQEPGWFDVAFSHADALPDAIDGVAMPAPLTALVAALDALVASGELAPTRRPGAEWPCWSAVHGFALLALNGPLRAQPPAVVRAAAERTVDTIIAGLLA